MKKFPMTLRGVEQLREKLDYLKNVLRPIITKSISEARRHGDLKENAEYHAAREQQGFCEGRIREIEYKLSNVYIVDVTKVISDKKVVFGVTVCIENVITQCKKIYRIVGDDESNLKKNMISISSPIAQGLIGHKEGDIVLISTPNGKIEYRIVKIEYLEE
ncbi:transcription elongation factor GreA [Candidatus Blochmanniella vafra str. BVAF]|uniref:Transcription elongation factor GreA n=1 Tax=Blochmanniella vafra (strain BVAF) TaxID=859654 RepID=E8Q6R4_BLOVB|nr:transcription elongation factor GreA [Candidatus Blochmannia vafer]ADV33505.1 transcription elongation factor GreA [Candidatus Blochmannia vafer str. BVAF]